MKKLIKSFALGLLLLPTLVFATPVSWDYTSSVLRPLQSMWTNEVKVPYITATSTSNQNTFPLASTTALTTTRGYVTQLANLTGNGFVKTGSGNGTLSIDTSTYLTTVDISANTNLTADGTEIILTGDALSLGTNLTFTNATSSTSFQTPLLGVGSDYISDITGTGLTLTNGVLSASGGASLFYPNLTGAKYVRAASTTVASGYLDVYTVPVGKKAIVKYRSAYNAATTTALTWSAIKVSGSYYRLTADQNITTITANSAAVPTIVLEAGESIAFNSDKAGVNVWYNVEEFTDTVAIKTAKILALANGDNTLYTVPASTNTMLQDIAMMYSAGGQQAQVRVANFSGGARTITMYAIPSGGSVGTTTIAIPSASYVDATVQGKDFPATMSSGDYIVINTNSGTAGQFVWVNLVEIPE